MQSRVLIETGQYERLVNMICKRGGELKLANDQTRVTGTPEGELLRFVMRLELSIVQSIKRIFFLTCLNR